ncbi:MAG: TetR/AcrR family transcriptional regulator [Acidimicrobiales bacterium]
MTTATEVSASLDDPTRDALLTAAGKVFAEKGYDRAGVQAIARQAGFTTGAIYGRFRGKADLLLAAIAAQTHDEFKELFAEGNFAGEATDIIATLGSHLVTEEFDSGQALLLEAFVAGRREPELGAMLRELMDERVSELTTLIEEGKRSGSVDPDLDSFSIVMFCHAVGLGFLLFGALGLERPSPGPWDVLIDRLVGAVARDQAAGPADGSGPQHAEQLAGVDEVGT